jgi:hypothetical protein
VLDVGKAAGRHRQATFGFRVVGDTIEDSKKEGGL